MDLLYLLLRHFTYTCIISGLILILSVLIYYSIPSNGGDIYHDPFIQILLKSSYHPRVFLTTESSTSLRHTMIELEKSSVSDNERRYYRKDDVLRRNVCIVIAHPDDEAMFFTPTILQLIHWNQLTTSSRQDTELYGLHRKQPQQLQIYLYLLCLSEGNAEGLGKTRANELLNSARVLGIPIENVNILSHAKLQDGMNEVWDVGFISDTLIEYVHRWELDLLLTFDDYGVSGHPNHRSIYFGIQHLMRHSLDSRRVKAYALMSANRVIKFTSWFSLLIFPFITSRCSFSFINTPDQLIFHAIKAMRQHSSQLNWFRWLYILTSIYMIHNSYRIIK